MTNNKKFFIVIAVIILFVSMLCSTFVISGLKPDMHKSFLLEIINVKIKK